VFIRPVITLENTSLIAKKEFSNDVPEACKELVRNQDQKTFNIFLANSPDTELRKIVSSVITVF